VADIAQPSLFDPCARKHGGNPNSVAANLRNRPHKDSDRESIRIQIASQGFAGLTLNEVQIWDPSWRNPRTGELGRYKPANAISGRLTELVADQEIFVSGRKRQGCSVYVSRREWANVR
jgi:hypothetical protein